MGRSRIFLFNCVRANAVCDATNIMTITHRKFIHGLSHKKEVVQVYADEEQLDNHACRTYHSSAQQSGLELPDVKQRY